MQPFSDQKMDDQPYSFYFRGAGLANIVVGFVRNKTNYVWRFQLSFNRNDDDECNSNYTSKFYSEQMIAHYNFIKNTLSPMFQLDLTKNIKLIEISTRYLDRICSDLPDLNDKLKHLRKFNTIYVFEMPDLAVQKIISSSISTQKTAAIFTVELKPKQGHTTGLSEFRPYCTNCLLQILKSKSGIFNTMYGYCPLQLFSGDLEKMKSSLSRLVDNPHNNL